MCPSIKIRYKNPNKKCKLGKINSIKINLSVKNKNKTICLQIAYCIK